MCKIDNEDYYSDYKWVEDLYRKVGRDLSWAPTLLRDIPQVGEFIDMINRASPTK